MFIGHKAKITVFMLLCLIFSVCVFAQEAEDWYYSKTIAAVDFDGLESVKKSDLSGIIKSYVGKKFSDELYYELVGRLGALDYFESIEPIVSPGDTEYNSVIITFSVIENPSIFEIKFVGNKDVTETALKANLIMKNGDIFQESVLATEERTLIEFYLKKGYTNIRITSRYDYLDEGISVTFIVNEGTSTVLRSISFEGNQVISTRTLQNTMQLKTKSLFNKGAFQESTLEIDKQSIITYYQSRGYIDAELTDVIREESMDEDGNCFLDLTFVIYEGYQYTYGGMEFQGNWLFSSAFLASKIKLSEGDVFNYTKFSEGLSAIADVYYNNGYISTGIAPEQYKDVDRQEISFIVYIDEQARSHVESIIVQGNKKTKDEVILREIPFEPGDVFSVSKYTNGYRNLANLQYFSSIVPEIIPGSEDDLVNVIYNVEDTSTTSIEFGLSFAGLTDPNSFPVSLFVTWQDSNLAGTGKTISTSLNIAPDSQSLSFGFADNWLFGEPISYSTSLSATHNKLSALQKVFTPFGLDTTSYAMKYNQLDISFSNSLGRRWFPGDVTISANVGINNEFLRNFVDENVVPVDSSVSNYTNTWGLINTVWGSVSADARDFRSDPSSGWFASEKLSWVGLVPSWESQFFLRSDTTGEFYFTLIDEPITEKFNLKVIFAAISKLSFVSPLRQDSISNSSRLAIDGMFVGRGWDSIYSLKGNSMWANSLELRIPVVPNIIAADLFLDAVALQPSHSLTNVSSNDFYFSFGPGVRSLVPQFPIRVMLANTFRMVNGNFSWGNGKGPEWKVVLSFSVTNL